MKNIIRIHLKKISSNIALILIYRFQFFYFSNICFLFGGRNLVYFLIFCIFEIISFFPLLHDHRITDITKFLSFFNCILRRLIFFTFFGPSSFSLFISLLAWLHCTCSPWTLWCVFAFEKEKRRNIYITMQTSVYMQINIIACLCTWVYV